MRVIVGGQCYSTPVGSSVAITNSASDPVPTCKLNIYDNDSALNIVSPQEMLILDDQKIPNPTVNLAPNPTLNPYTTSWFTTPTTGLTYTQVSGGGLKLTLANVALNNSAVVFLYTYIPYAPFNVPGQGFIVPGQTYTLSFYVQGSSSPTNFNVQMYVDWLNVGENYISSSSVISGPTPPSTTSTRYTLTATAPAGAAVASIALNINGPSSTNSGSVTISNIQFEPNWIPTLSYPTPFCGPAQTNCQQLPNSQWIRQYRKFAGFVTNVQPQDYHGNSRTIEVDGSGYAWLLSTIYGNDSFTNQTGAQIIKTLLGKYLLSNGNAMCTTTNVITDNTFSDVQLNWDDLRTTFDDLCSSSAFYWTIDYYWNAVYAPPGYFSQGIALICDNSSTPNMTTTFPAYNFQAQSDFTQPGSTILVIGGTSGSTTYTAKVVDPSQTAQIGQTCGYFLPVGSSWMRKVNEDSLLSNADCIQRGQAEWQQYNRPRGLYHCNTNVELDAGYGVVVTSNTDGLSNTMLLVQQVTAQWLGTSETLMDTWEYQVDLGAANRSATNILSRLFRSTNANSSAPTLATATLVFADSVGIEESITTSTQLSSNYWASIQPDGPLAYYPLSELPGGTIADDVSGHANQGTIHASPTLGAAGLLTDSADSTATAILFAGGSSQYISLPTTFVPTGSHAWSIECWFKIASGLANGFYTMAGFGQRTTDESGQLKCQVNSGAYTCILSGFGADISAAMSANTVYHAVGTYDGTSTRLYLNGSLVAGPTAYALNIVANFASIGADGSTATDFFTGTIQAVAFYNTALSSTQISAHYAAGT